ncbi:hypothetical protein FB451DRAFT_1481927 [Mycena latifolia]|nr:hypothetical protein FB451DRAFT_1481927 [Mycena latifolia]
MAPDLTRTVSQLNAAVQIFPKMFGAMGTWARTRAEGRAVRRAPWLRFLLSCELQAREADAAERYAHEAEAVAIHSTISMATISRATEAPTKRAALLASSRRPSRLCCSPLASMRGGGRYHGAEYLGPALLKRFGLDAFTIVDEGGAFSQNFGALFTVPGVTEEGSVNEDIEVQTPDRHSSMPPARTSIGVLIAIVMT